MIRKSLFLTMVRTRFPNDCMWCYGVLGVTNNHYIPQIDRKLLVEHDMKDFFDFVAYLMIQLTAILSNEYFELDL